MTALPLTRPRCPRTRPRRLPRRRARGPSPAFRPRRHPRRHPRRRRARILAPALLIPGHHPPLRLLLVRRREHVVGQQARDGVVQVREGGGDVGATRARTVVRRVRTRVLVCRLQGGQLRLLLLLLLLLLLGSAWILLATS